MEEYQFELSPEMIQACVELRDVLIDVWNKIQNAIVELGKILRGILEAIGRSYLQIQLLEWRIPYPLSALISKHGSWMWGWKLLAMRFYPILNE